MSTAGHWLPSEALDGNEDVSPKQLFVCGDKPTPVPRMVKHPGNYPYKIRTLDWSNHTGAAVLGF